MSIMNPLNPIVACPLTPNFDSTPPVCSNWIKLAIFVQIAQFLKAYRDNSNRIKSQIAHWKIEFPNSETESLTR